MSVSQAFGKAIKMRRVQLGVTQEELSNAAEMARSFVSGIERGEKQATTKSVYKLAIALKTLPSELWKSTEEMLGEES